jgi:hypothetical protein
MKTYMKKQSSGPGSSSSIEDFSEEEIGKMTLEEYKLACTGQFKRTPAAPQIVPSAPKSKSPAHPKGEVWEAQGDEWRSGKGGIAIMAGHKAARLRRSGAAAEDPRVAALEKRAQTATQAESIEVGCGEAIRGSDTFPSGLRDTLANPTLVAADASEQRSRLAVGAGVLEMALDVAMTFGAENSIEKMLAAHVALSHKMAMRFGKFALTETDAKSASMAHKLSTTSMRSCQQTVDTLNRCRRGGRQLVTVQRVNINEGGKAVIAGHVNEPAA